jgi:hypothetical protein
MADYFANPREAGKEQVGPQHHKEPGVHSKVGELLIGALIMEASQSGQADEDIRQCWASPDGWKEECAKAQSLKDLPEPRWSPPKRFANWPKPTDL